LPLAPWVTTTEKAAVMQVEMQSCWGELSEKLNIFETNMPLIKLLLSTELAPT